MKLFVVALVSVFTASAFVVKTEKEILRDILSRKIPVEAERLTGQALADYVNSQQQFFKAEVPEMSVKRRKARLMDVKYVEQKADFIAPEIDTISNDDIPSNFDARQKWSNCPSINNIRDQSDCGSCWAFAATEAMSDRICIASQGQVQVSLSAEDMLSCCGDCGNGCEGGYDIRAWEYWVNAGVCTGGSYAAYTGCKPYVISPCGYHANETFYRHCPKGTTEPTPKCTNECVYGYPKTYNDDKYYGQSAYGLEQSVAAIQKEIMTNGPVEAAFTVYSDFDQYTGGIYVHTAGKEEGGHAVKLLGWGTENGTPYWLVANSWSKDWGENGFFRIIRGINECGIEEAIVAGLPKY